MDETEIMCPWCGEMNLIMIEADVMGELVEDCEVCCQPMRLVVTRDEWNDPSISVDRAA